MVSRFRLFCNEAPSTIDHIVSQGCAGQPGASVYVCVLCVHRRTICSLSRSDSIATTAGSTRNTSRQRVEVVGLSNLQRKQLARCTPAAAGLAGVPARIEVLRCHILHKHGARSDQPMCSATARSSSGLFVDDMALLAALLGELPTCSGERRR